MTKIFNRVTSKPIRQKLRSSLTKGEVIVWNHIKGRQLGGFKFRRQESIGVFVVDFYCPELKLAVEIDGLTHNFEEIFERDQWRQKLIEEQGVVFKRYSSDAVFNNLRDFLNDLLMTCESLPRMRNSGNHPGLWRPTPPWKGGDNQVSFVWTQLN